jgi:hypothetical protein
MWYLGELINKPEKMLKPGEGESFFVIEQSLDTAKYRDITTVTNINKIGRKLKDYAFIRLVLKTMMDDVSDPFWSLSTEEKELICIYCAVSDETIVTYYVTIGMSLQEAQMLHINRRSVDVRFAANSYYSRLTQPEFMAIIITYLGLIQGETFMDAIRNFSTDVRDMARLGTMYSNVNDGLMDYIESTGSYVDGGLKNYTITAGLTLEGLIKNIKDLFYYGYTS